MFLASISLLKELIMKKSFKLLFGSFVLFSLIACGTQTTRSEDSQPESSVPESTVPLSSSEESIKPSSLSSSSNVISSNSSSSTEKSSSSSTSSVVPSSSASSVSSSEAPSSSTISSSSSEAPSSSSSQVSSSSSEQSSSSSSSNPSSSSEEPSSSVPTPTYYHVVFQNYDETVLLEIDVLEGNEAVYSGETPTKPEDDEFTYEFEKWDQEDNLKAVTSDVTTKAVFTATAKENWGPIHWFDD